MLLLFNILKRYPTFLSRVSMQCMHSAILLYQFCPSVCMSVRPMAVLSLNERTDREDISSQFLTVW